MIQIELSNLIFQRFGDFVIDFWAGFATALGQLQDFWNSGDGVHLNDDAHRVLLDRVLEARIPETLLVEKTGINSTYESRLLDLKIFPNPTIERVFLPDWNSSFLLRIYSKEGQLLIEREQSDRVVKLPTSGLQYIEVQVLGKSYGAWVVRN